MGEKAEQNRHQDGAVGGRIRKDWLLKGKPQE
jgi:hypothetical protein